MPGRSLTFVCHEYGDSGVLVDLVADEHDVRWQAAQVLGAALRRRPPPGLVDVVASFEHVFVSFDPLTTDHARIRSVVEDVLDHGGEQAPSRLFEVPVQYGDDGGPCLLDVAELCDLAPEEVVELHASREWTVRFVGSPVGAPFMDGPRLPRSIPRLVTPRARMEPGSVALSGFQSMIYNAPSPGGWRVIGLSPSMLFDLSRPPHVPYRPGDRIRFRPITGDEWERWRRPVTEVGR